MAQDSETYDPNPQRRQLLVATSALGGVAIAATAVPFVVSMVPSERARSAGAPVEADITKLGPGELATVEWRGRPVWLLRRTPEMVSRLSQIHDLLLDPNSERDQQPKYCVNETRSIKPDLLVSVALCTHLGCVPTPRREVAPLDLGPDWPGGFYCPCHGSKFDLAARVFKNVPAPLNLEIPRHKYLADNLLLIGTDDEQA